MVRREDDKGNKLAQPYLTTKSGLRQDVDVDVYPGSLDTQHLAYGKVCNWLFHKDSLMFEGSDVSKEKIKFLRVDMKLVTDEAGLTDEENTKAAMCVLRIPYKTVFKGTDDEAHPCRA